MKLKILSASIMSLLLFSNSSSAEVLSTVTLGGISKTFSFVDEAAARAASESPSDEQINFFRDTNGDLPTSLIGQSTETTLNGKPVTLMRTAQDTTVLVEKDNTGASTFTTLTRPDKTVTMDDVVNAFVDNTPIANSVQDNIDTTQYTAVQGILSEVKNVATVAGSDEALAQAKTSASVNTALVSTQPVASPITSNVTLNGVTKTFNFASQAEADAFANDSGNRSLFDNATSRVGMVVKSKSGGLTNIFTQTSADTVVVAKPTLNGDGGFEYFTVTKPTTADSPSLNNIVSSFLEGNADGVPEGSVVKGISDQATVAKVRDSLNSVDYLTEKEAAALKDGQLLKVAAATEIVAIDDFITASESIAIAALQAEVARLEALVNPTAAEQQALKDAQVDLEVTVQEATNGAVTISTDPTIQVKALTKVAANATTALAILNSSASEATRLQALADFNDAQASLGALDPNKVITSSVILNDQVRTFTFANEAEAQAFADSPTQFRDLFNNAISQTGQVVQNTTALGEKTLFVRTATDTIVVGQYDANGVLSYQAVTVGANDNFNSLNAKVAAYLRGNTALATDIDAATRSLLEAQLKVAKGTLGDTSLNNAILIAQNLVNPVDPTNPKPTEPAVNVKLQAAIADVNLLAANAILEANKEAAKVTNAVGNSASLEVRQASANVTAVANQVTSATVTTWRENSANRARLKASLVNVATRIATIKTSQFQVERTASSQIAGNPASAMNMIIDNMFAQSADADDNNLVNIASASSDSGIKSSMGVGLQYGYYDLAGTTVHMVTMPLNYSAQLNPRSKLLLSIPLSYINTEGRSDAYQVGVNAGYQYSLTNNWSLTPAFSYAYRALDEVKNVYLDSNEDTSIFGGSITSRYTWNLSPSDSQGVRVSMTNMAGYFESSGLDDQQTASFGSNANGTFSTGFATGEDISNFVLKNSVKVSKSLKGFRVSGYVTDNEFFGDNLYFEQYNEAGVSVKPENMGKLNALSVDANYIFSLQGGDEGDLDGFKVNLNYRY